MKNYHIQIFPVHLFSASGIFHDKRGLALSSAAGLTGAFTGVFFLWSFPPEEAALLAENLISTAGGSLANAASFTLGNLIFLLILYLLRFSVYGFLLLPALVFLKNLSLGFSTGLLMELTASGNSFLTAPLFIAAILLLTVLILAAGTSFNYGSAVLHNTSGNKTLARELLFHYIIFILLTLVSGAGYALAFIKI